MEREFSDTIPKEKTCIHFGIHQYNGHITQMTTIHTHTNNYTYLRTQQFNNTVYLFQVDS